MIVIGFVIFAIAVAAAIVVIAQKPVHDDGPTSIRLPLVDA